MAKSRKPPVVEEAEPEEAGEGEASAPKGRSLVIVESPAKAKTINKYLGRGYVVRASMGHVRDLPTGRLGIDMEKGFKPEYVEIKSRAKILAELKKLAKSAPSIYLAPDPDREGEAIAWHLMEALGLTRKDDHVFRVVFNEITKNAVLAAFEKPGKLDLKKVDAQQARRVLDRIVGYKLSPLLWKKVAKGLSAGRVQSVAVRVIVDREKEIRAFVQEEYWRVTAHFEEGGQAFGAELKQLGELRIDKNLDQAGARALVARIGSSALALVELEEKPKSRNPTPAFTTSQLQQKGSTMLRFSAKKTMMLAQRLYEGIEIDGEGAVGLITYMRTDSTRVSQDAIVQVRGLIEQRFGQPYLPSEPNYYKTKSKGAQEAHEAIRPTDVSRTPESLAQTLEKDQLALYTLIWNKFVSSQMKPQTSNVTTATFAHPAGSDEPAALTRGREVAQFVAQGEVVTFDGFTRVFVTRGPDEDTQVLPKSLKQGLSYQPTRIEPTQHFTQPPPRYTEASLVKELEKRGIGRPSTYATIISTIQDRGYVTLDARRFKATELGEIVTDQLVLHFADIVNTEFTARMESELDEVEEGDKKWREVVGEFNEVFARDLERANADMKNWKREPVLTDKPCDKCGAPMAELFNKRGKFLGCSRYPECKNIASLDGTKRERSEVVPTDKTCEKCGKPMVIRTGSRGRFIACTGYPKCKNTASVDDQGNVIKPEPTGEKCDKCGADMVVKGSRRGPFLACSAYPKCRNAKPLPGAKKEEPKLTGEKCDKCGEPMALKRSRWGKEFLACTGYPKCKNARNVETRSEDPGSAQPTPVGASESDADEADD